MTKEALDHIANGGKMIEQPAQQCTGCEGNPKYPNNPCVLCGCKVEQPAQQEPAPGYCKHCKQYTIEELLPAQRTWVGLLWGNLPEDGQNHDFLRGAVWAEAKLKEKNT